jgi:hypothetical protein
MGEVTEVAKNTMWAVDTCLNMLAWATLATRMILGTT